MSDSQNTGHTHEVTGVSFMPESRYLISSGSDKALRLWDIEEGREKCVFYGEGAIMSVTMITSTSVAAGDSLGNLYILGLRGSLVASGTTLVFFGPVLLTPFHLRQH